MTPPKITFLMPIFNGEEIMLRTAIRTAANQSYPNLDLVLIDNGSTRATTLEIEKEAKERWPDRVVLTHENEKRGTAYALDAGLRIADKGTVYFTKGDADDIFHKDREANRVKLFETLPPQVAGVYDNFLQLVYWPRPHVLPVILRPYDYRAHVNESYVHGNTMWRASVYEKIPKTFVYDGYENPKANRHAEDYAHWLAIGDHWDFFWMNCDPANAWVYRVYRDSKYHKDRRGVDYARSLVQHIAKERRGLL